MHYLGTSYGLTKELFGFWMKSGYRPVYVRQTCNDLTGEHSCIMIKNLENQQISENISVSKNWLDIYFNDFSKRFVSLLSFEFRHFDLQMCLKILNPRLTTNREVTNSENEIEKVLNEATGKPRRAQIEPFVSLLD